MMYSNKIRFHIKYIFAYIIFSKSAPDRAGASTLISAYIKQAKDQSPEEIVSACFFVYDTLIASSSPGLFVFAWVRR